MSRYSKDHRARGNADGRQIVIRQVTVGLYMGALIGTIVGINGFWPAITAVAGNAVLVFAIVRLSDKANAYLFGRPSYGMPGRLLSAVVLTAAIASCASAPYVRAITETLARTVIEASLPAKQSSPPNQDRIGA